MVTVYTHAFLEVDWSRQEKHWGTVEVNKMLKSIFALKDRQFGNQVRKI